MQKTKRKILLVENEKNWHKVMRAILDEYDLQIAPTYEYALKKLSESDIYDLLIININLLNLSEQLERDRLGLKLLKRLRDTNYPAPCILVTGDPDIPVRYWFDQYNVDDMFIKGKFNLDRFLNTVEKKIGTNNMDEKYIDFDLHINQDGHITAVCKAEGEVTDTISVDVPSHIQQKTEMIAKNKTDDVFLRNFGEQLYELIFLNQIHTLFHQTEASARLTQQKLRIRLNIEPDMLSRLPWECLYRQHGGYFLATNPNTVLSRYLNLSAPPNRVRRREGPLHMLIIISSPIDQAPLDLDRWEEVITNALAVPIQENTVTTRTVKVATFENISDALFQQKPDIVQFVGHGIYLNNTGYLALVDSQTGKTWAIDHAQFANIFLGFDDHLGLVSLATCESAKSDSPSSFLGIAPQIVQRGIPAVVAMQYQVLISTAEIFLENFYKAVAARKPVDWAVQWARNAISIRSGLDNREFVTPVLYMRAKDGDIF